MIPSFPSARKRFHLVKSLAKQVLWTLPNPHSEAFSKAIGCFSQPDGKPLFLRITFTYIKEHEEIKQVPD